MNTILSDLYHGKIYPQEKASSPQEMKEHIALEKRREAILDQLPQGQRKALEALFEAESALEAQMIESTYIAGMRMGARLMQALLE